MQILQPILHSQNQIFWWWTQELSYQVCVRFWCTLKCVCPSHTAVSVGHSLETVSEDRKRESVLTSWQSRLMGGLFLGVLFCVKMGKAGENPDTRPVHGLGHSQETFTKKIEGTTVLMLTRITQSSFLLLEPDKLLGAFQPWH